MMQVLTNRHERLLLAFLPALVPVRLSLHALRGIRRHLARHRGGEDNESRFELSHTCAEVITAKSAEGSI